MPKLKTSTQVTARLTNHGLHFKVVVPVDDPKQGLAEITSDQFICAPRKALDAALAAIGYVRRHTAV